MKLFKESTAQSDATESGRALCLFLGCVSSFVGLIVLSYGFFTDIIIHGPAFDVLAPPVDSNTVGVATFTPTELTDTRLRNGWNAASSLILFGIAAAWFTGMRVLRDLDTHPLFSAETTRTIVSGSIGAGLLVSLGGLVRWFLEDRIGAAVGIESAAIDNGPQFREWLWILDVPFLVLALILMAVGGAWVRAQSLQSDVEGVV